jgi:hypothetical protein
VDSTCDPRFDPIDDSACDPIEVVVDSAGVVVGLGSERAAVDNPAAHAAWLTKTAIESDGLRGRWVAGASVLNVVYRRMARAGGIEPWPWPTVAGLLGQTLSRKAKWVALPGVGNSAGRI